jgi:hypothetical protein
MIQNNFFTQTRLTLQTRSLTLQMARILSTVMISFIVIMLVLSLVLMLNQQFNVRVSNLTTDPNALNGSRFYIGLVSVLGVMSWSATVGICWLGTAVLRHRPATHEQTRFLRLSGLITLLLALDDAFMLHEVVFPNYFGIPENVVYLGYAFLLIAYLRLAWFQILASDYLLFMAAFLLLGTSVALDVVLPYSNRMAFLEDVLKFSGIIFWLAYFYHATRSLLAVPQSGAAGSRAA